MTGTTVFDSVKGIKLQLGLGLALGLTLGLAPLAGYIWLGPRPGLGGLALALGLG